MIVLCVVLGIVLSGFYAGSESAFTIVNRLTIRTWARSGGPQARRAESVEALLATPERVLTATLAGNNVALVAVTSLIAYEMDGRGVPEGLRVLIDVVFVTGILLILGEILPKAVARRQPEKLALHAAAPLRISMVLLWPLGWFAASVAKILLRGLRAPLDPERFGMSRQDVIHLLRAGEEVGVLESGPDNIISGIFDFGTSTVREALTPRTELVALEISASEVEILATVREGRFTRLPVYDGDLDHVVGIVHALDLLLASQDGPLSLAPHLRPVLFTPESKGVSELLGELQERREHAAVVVDEHGGTEGIVTLEDILELLVGDIRDEHDDVDDLLRQVTDGAWMASGRLELDDLADRIGIELPDGEYETLGGYVLASLGKIPRKGEVIESPGLRITVLKATDRSVETLRIDQVEVD